MLVAAVLSVVVWAAYREVDRTLTNAASERSRATAGQVANLFEGLMRPMVARVRLAGSEPALRAFLADPSSANRAAADAVIAQINTGSTARHIALWDAAGARVISVAEPGRADNDGPASVPESTTVPDEGLSPLVATDGGAYLDLVAVVSGVFPGLERVGALSLRIALSINPPGLIGQLVGRDAIIKLGNRDGSVWVDLTDLSVAPPPPIDLTSVGPARYDDAGGPHLGALAEIEDTPWLAWVEFPRETVQAPARQFLRRMLWFGALAALLGALLVRFVTARVTAPLARMTDASEAIAAGDYSRKVDTGRLDEIGRLGRAFDRMTEQVAQDITHRETVARVLQE
ncbi:MAG: HAMP domain-containing protein, partial [Acidobacteriota bacterium]|nr:HAMP domain-containing protein [Acidobacteriota bacterium]